jgi:hypothetical protein
MRRVGDELWLWAQSGCKCNGRLIRQFNEVGYFEGRPCARVRPISSKRHIAAVQHHACFIGAMMLSLGICRCILQYPKADNLGRGHATRTSHEHKGDSPVYIRLCTCHWCRVITWADRNRPGQAFSFADKAD